MDSDTPNIERRITELQKQVAPYSKGEIKSSNNEYISKMFTGYKIYMYIPIGLLIILLFWRPTFTMNEGVDENGETVYKLSFKKLLITWMTISALLIIGIYGFQYKSKN